MSTPNARLSDAFPKTEQDVPEYARLSGPLHQDTYLVDGQMRTWAGATHTVTSALGYSTDQGFKPVEVGSYPLLGPTEALEALDAAVKAYDHGRGEWPTMSIAGRIACMDAFTKKMIAVKDEVVKLLMWEIGKSHGDAIKEFDRTVEYIVATIDELKEMDRAGSRFTIEQGIIAQVRRAPLGVVLCMGPFNYPLNETFTVLIPALLMGNTILFKPPKHGTLLHFPLLEAFRTSFPAGVVNTVYGRGNSVVPVLMHTGLVNCLALIGSSRVADELKKSHPKSNRLRTIFGLDAKNTGIILPDADLDLTVKECILGTLSFNGQRCTALKILWVHRSIADQFVQALSKAVEEQQVGMPWTEKVSITPLPEPNKPGYLAELIADAKQKGAMVINTTGGQAFNGLVFPAVVYPVSSNMRLYDEEQFGPVIPIVPFDDVEEPIQYLIDSDHGQQVSIFGRDSRQLATLIDPLVNQVCRVNINAQCQRGPDVFPFTGRKDSAEGTLSVYDALRSFSIRTLVATKQTDDNKRILNEIVSEHTSKFLSTHYIL